MQIWFHYKINNILGGHILIIPGFIIWFVGALKSGMDESITENKLKTDGIYAWVRNPM
jgi:protein-S-isoprenylcysteine O-methyltransferase Ste14